MMSQAIDLLKNIQQTQEKMLETLSKVANAQQNIYTSLISLTNAYIEVHKKEHPSVENFHLSQ